MNRQNVDLGSGKVGKLLFSLALPTITSQIVNMLYNLVDRIYIGHMQPAETVGKLALTGVGVCLPIIMVISAFAALLGMGGAPRASIAEGRGDIRESERIMGNSFTLLAAVSLVLTVVYGDDIAVGAMTVLTSIMQFAMMPLQGLTQGAQPIISYNYGARNPGRVREAFRVLLRACVVYSLCLWALVQLFPRGFAMLFTSAPDLVDYAAWALRIYMGATGIFGIQIACQQTFIALGNAKTSLFLAVLRKIILLVPLIYILPGFFADKAFAVFLAEPVADVLAVCTTASMFAVQFKRSMAELEKGV